MAPKDSAETITTDILLYAYSVGIFPMSDSASDDQIFWIDPDIRAVIPLADFHISRSLAKRLRQARYTVSLNAAFDDVLAACADRSETWINPEIAELYRALNKLGHAHSLEVWADGALVGGVYGVALGGAFFGESMFSRQTDASKIALAFLTDRLRYAGFRLFDVQFPTDHLASLGAITIPRAAYHEELACALSVNADIRDQPSDGSAAAVIQRNTQTS